MVDDSLPVVDRLTGKGRQKEECNITELTRVGAMGFEENEFEVGLRSLVVPHLDSLQPQGRWSSA